MTQSIYDILKSRGFIAQCTAEAELKAKLSEGPVTFYIGFDPTNDCLHVGNLLPVMCMAWLQKAGHFPIVVLGGGTAMVGDPSGKDKTRELLTPDKIQSNLDGIRPSFGQFLDLERTKILNNADWLCKLNYIEFLRDIGKHFSVNQMIKAEGARQRLERNQGYSFIEFNYHLLQSYDFLYLQQHHGCTLQVGGDDQWFHFCGGVELIRRESRTEGFAFTIPLLTTADGKKMGKSEKGAVWIDSRRMSVYDYYQYWVNVQDADVVRLMKLYTFMDLDEIDTYAQLQGADIRKAKARLALEATALAHGETAALEAQKAAQAVFQSGGVSANMPTYAADLPAKLVDLLSDSGLAKSKSAARRLITGGAVKLDFGDGKTPVKDIDAELSLEAVLWAGKKSCVRITAQ